MQKWSTNATNQLATYIVSEFFTNIGLQYQILLCQLPTLIWLGVINIAVLVSLSFWCSFSTVHTCNKGYVSWSRDYLLR